MSMCPPLQLHLAWPGDPHVIATVAALRHCSSMRASLPQCTDRPTAVTAFPVTHMGHMHHTAALPCPALQAQASELQLQPPRNRCGRCRSSGGRCAVGAVSAAGRGPGQP